MGSEKWPFEMYEAKENLDRTKKFDIDLIDSRGNDYDIVTGLIKDFRRHFMQSAEQKERKFMVLKYFDEYGTPPASSRVAVTRH